MADVMILNDGSMQIVFGLPDMLQVIETHVGFEARRWLEEYLEEDDDLSAYTSDLEEQIKDLKEHHHEVMGDLRKVSEEIAVLIREKNIDRNALSAAAGKIGILTWRELNV